MFGTLKPKFSALRCGERGDWQRFYCGTCQSLGAQFGHAYRGLLSHDAVFLALLADGLSDEAAAPDRTRCPLLPIVHRPTVSPSSTAMRYAAAVQMLLADQWLADRAIDGGALARAARPLVRRPSEQARATLATLDSELDALIGFEHEQAASERRGETRPREAAEPTAAALELVLGRIADLPGVTPAPAPAELPASSCEAEPRALLEQLGRGLGRAIYLIDALEDLDEDRRTGDFNACLADDARGRPRLDPERIEQASALLRAACRSIVAALAGLPLRRHRPVLTNILVAQIGARAELAIAGAEQLVAEVASARRRRLLWAPARASLRLAQAVFVVAWTFATTVWSRVVQAATETGGSETGGSETGATETGATETGGAALDPDLPPPPDLGTIPDPEGGSAGGRAPSCFEDLCQSFCGGLSEACGRACEDVCGDFGKLCSSGCIDGCGSACGDACTNVCGNCNVCDEVCNGFGDTCSGVCDGVCGGCGDACSEGCGSVCGGCGDTCGGCGGACGDCGNACGGCGNTCGDCGNGCGGCANGCNGCANGCNGCGNGCNGC